jgi:pilus assembly protein Flp/PilA
VLRLRHTWSQRGKFFDEPAAIRLTRDLSFQCVGCGFNDYREGSAMFVTSIKRFLASEDGPTAVEYAVMLALIIVVCLTAIQAVGTNANTQFNAVKNALS